MIKLTDEQIFQLLISVDSETKRLPSGFKEFARAIEAEVLRLNGITEQKLIRTNYCCPDAVGTGKVVCTNCAMTQEDYQDDRPRATGCPDTMDDTGRFAEVDMPAFLRKQNPA